MRGQVQVPTGVRPSGRANRKEEAIENTANGVRIDHGRMGGSHLGGTLAVVEGAIGSAPPGAATDGAAVAVERWLDLYWTLVRLIRGLDPRLEGAARTQPGVRPLISTLSLGGRRSCLS